MGYRFGSAAFFCWGWLCQDRRDRRCVSSRQGHGFLRIQVYRYIGTCIHVCVYIYIYAYIYIYTYCTYVCISTSVHTFVCIHLYLYIRTCFSARRLQSARTRWVRREAATCPLWSRQRGGRAKTKEAPLSLPSCVYMYMITFVYTYVYRWRYEYIYIYIHTLTYTVYVSNLHTVCIRRDVDYRLNPPN